MHSVYQRLNAVWASGVMVLCFMLAFNHITSLAVQPVVSGSIAVHSLERLTAQSIQKDACRYSLSIDADLREALDWGVKQLFVYVVAEYETTDRKRNQLVVWDRIIETEEDAKFSVQNVDPKYPLIDDGTGLRAADVRFSLHYEQVPISGLMRLSALGGATFVAST